MANPIKISNIDIASGGKVSLGSRWLDSDTKCSVLLTWTGNDKLTILCTSPNNIKKSYFIENGELTIFQPDTADKYTISVKNESNHTIKNLNGTIDYAQNTNASVQSNNEISQTVIYESVEMHKYDDYPELGIEGSPYIHDIKTNNTDKKIVSTERGMTAFDKEGNPLKLQWNGLDSSSKPSYYFLYDWDTTEIPPYQKDDIVGGWSLDIFGKDSNVAKIAYVLYCDKKITFDDGTVWKNPDFEKWLSTYEGKKVDVETLNNYYPFEQNIVFEPSK